MGGERLSHTFGQVTSALNWARQSLPGPRRGGHLHPAMSACEVPDLCLSSGGHAQEAEREKEGPVQGRLYRSLKLWSFYCDLEESLGTMESTQAVYDRILELRIATPQLILNYALFLQVSLCQCMVATQQRRDVVICSSLGLLDIPPCSHAKSVQEC